MGVAQKGAQLMAMQDQLEKVESPRFYTVDNLASTWKS